MLVTRRLPIGYIFSKVGYDLVFVVSVGIAIEILVYYVGEQLPRIPVAVAAFLGTAISLLLSFKLSQSYQRWWEARKIWGAIVNDSRSLSRQVLTFPGEAGQSIAERVVRRQIAWCYCLGQSLRQQQWTDGITGNLSHKERVEVKKHDNRPLALLQRHARDISELAKQDLVTDYQRVTLDHTLTRLTDAMGKAERIKSTVFPTAYRLYLHFFIYVFIFALALSLADLHGPREVVVITVISLPFFLLEKTATYLQDPFSGLPTDTSVTAIARVVEINLLQLLGETDVPPRLAARRFFLD